MTYRNALLPAFVFSAAFAALTCGTEVPALRHDWLWPVDQAQTALFLSGSLSGWDVTGFGNPAPYPSSYLLSLPLSVLLHVVPPAIALDLFLFGIGIVITLGVAKLIERFELNPAHRAALMGFALFNPWVYSEVVAGHLAMVLAYGGTFLLVAALNSVSSSWRWLAVILAIIFAQLQFFLLGLLALVARLRQPAAKRALLFGICILAPSAVGVAANLNWLRSTPFTLVWQEDQSIDPVKTFFLSGYSPHYADALSWFAVAAMWIIVGLSLAGLYTAVRSGDRNAALIALMIGLFFSVASSGTKGIAGAPYSFLVRHVPALGLFRELYDLEAYIVIAYTFLAAHAKARIFEGLAVLASAFLIVAWFLHPPKLFFIDRAQVPTSSFHAAENSRFALLPAFQPVTFHGHGSGIDPDFFSRFGNRTPVNTLVLQYPSSPALERYALTGSTSDLGALSVSAIITRSWLQSDSSSLRYQLNSNVQLENSDRTSIRRIPYLPELTTEPSTALAGVADRLGAGNVFFGDAQKILADLAAPRELPAVSYIRATNDQIDPSKGWIDCNLMFLTDPDLAQGLGGAATVSQHAVLRVPASGALLVSVRGSLMAGGDVISDTTNGYGWVGVPRRPLDLTCVGTCAVVAASTAIPNLPNNPRAQPYSEVPFRQLQPWLLSADVPVTKNRVLRYNTRYNEAWLAWSGSKVLTHFRLDQAVNGWFLQPASAPERLIIVNVVAAVQLLLEIAGIILTAAVAAALFLEQRLRYQKWQSGRS